MTEWERARTQKQKETREKEILSAARKLLIQKAYEDITFSDLAALVSFSRASIYQYFASKEEVYLALLAEEIRNFGIRCFETLKKVEYRDNPILGFGSAWAKLMGQEKILLQLLSMAGTILEKNCSDSILLQSKISMAQTVREYLVPSLLHFFPNIQEKEISQISNFLIITANGLYPLSGLNPNQKKLLEENGLGAMIHEFESDYKEIIVSYLKSVMGKKKI